MLKTVGLGLQDYEKVITENAFYVDKTNFITEWWNSKDDVTFGFTEKEVFESLDAYGYGAEKEKVKAWYDGFKFGSTEGIYNPWSIISFLQTGKYEAYWANTLEELCDMALKQIEDKKYESELLSAGYDKDKIKKFAFAFERKELLIKEG